MNKYLLFIALLFITHSTYGHERSEQEMYAIACNKLYGNQSRRAAQDYSIHKLFSSSQFHIYGDENNGFVIIAIDDFFKPILGYSQSRYRGEDMPEAFKYWLKNTEESMKYANNFLLYSDVPYTPTENFITTMWGQGDPYNYKSPEINGEKAPSGCVATAMSQIMKYYQYPVHGEGKGLYTKSSGNSIPMEVKGEYHWEQMMDSYKKVTLTDEIREPISTLMFDAGLACKMNYEDGGSGTNLFNAAYGFVHNFGYDSLSIKLYHQEYFNQKEWQDIIYKELSARRPILAAGFNETEGHAFVLSGIDTDGLIYINWGWDGNGDGYYAIDTWSPKGSSFNEGKSMICGFNPSKQAADGAKYQSYWISDGNYIIKYQKIRNWLLIKSDFIANYSPLSFSGTVNLCFEDEKGTMVKTYPIITETGKAPGYGYSSYNSGNVKVDELPAGTYKAYLASKAEKEDGYSKVRCTGGMIYYMISKDESGVITVSDAQNFETGITQSLYPSLSSSSVRYYNLQGQEVNGSFKGLLIRKQGNEMKKVVVK